MDDVVMPQMGESLAEGTIVRWLKAPGEPVERDEPIVEISTDKVDTEVPSPVAGILAEILAQPGETVAVGAVMARVGPRGAAGAVTTESASQDAAPPAEESSGHFKATEAPSTFQRGGLRVPAGGHPPAASTPRDPGPAANRSFSPAVLDAARTGGVPLDALVTLNGSGRGGRVTKRDVERFLAQRASGAPAGRPSASSGPAAGGAAAPEGVPPEYAYRPGPGDRRVPLSPVRRSIAQHMAWSVRISPHATAFAECDMSRAAAVVARDRERRNPAEPPVTYTVLVAEAAVAALAEFEVLNASIVGDDLVLKPHVNLGIAVAVPETGDLVVPVIHRAEDLSLPGLARAVHDVATRARARALTVDDVQGGTFTLTNPGIFGGLTGTPILNQPQVAILGLGAIVKRPVVVDEDAIAVRPMMTLSLTFDHRAADGMVAFQYLARVKHRLESADGAAVAPAG